MSAEFRALFLHGVGQQAPSFAEDARRNLRRALLAKGIKVHFESVHWAPVMDEIEAKIWADVQERGSDGNLTQKLFIFTMTDALCWSNNPDVREKIFAIVDEAASKFGGHEFHVFAHSLGGLVVVDWMRARKRAAKQLVTLGCNVGLFNAGKQFEPVPGLDHWLNLFSPSDMLGYAIAGTDGLAHVVDARVGVGGLLTGWNGLSHTAYFEDHDLWSKTIPAFLGFR